MDIHKVEVALEYQEDINIVKEYNHFIFKYQSIQDEIIQELSKCPILILEDKYEYCVIKNINIQLNQRHHQQYTLYCDLYNKAFGINEYAKEITLSELCNNILNKNIRIIIDKSELNSLCRLLKI